MRLHNAYDMSNFPTCIAAYDHYMTVSLEMKNLRNVNQPAHTKHNQIDLYQLESGLRTIYQKFRTCHLQFQAHTRASAHQSKNSQFFHKEL